MNTHETIEETLEVTEVEIIIFEAPDSAISSLAPNGGNSAGNQGNGSGG